MDKDILWIVSIALNVFVNLKNINPFDVIWHLLDHIHIIVFGFAGLEILYVYQSN